MLVEHSQAYWTGLSPTANWNDDANWESSKPVDNAGIYFGATAPGGHAGNNNNFPAGTQFNGITFGGDATATFTLQGHAIKLGGSVVNQSAHDQTIDLDLELVEGGYLFYAGTNDITVGGQLSGAGSLIKEGPGTLTLDGNPSYSGSTTVTAGTLVVTGALTQSPNIAVEGDAQLFAARIVADTLTIGTGSGTSSSQTVPEPSAIILAMFGGLCLFAYQLRRRDR